MLKPNDRRRRLRTGTHPRDAENAPHGSHPHPRREFGNRPDHRCRMYGGSPNDMEPRFENWTVPGWQPYAHPAGRVGRPPAWTSRRFDRPMLEVANPYVGPW